MRKKLLIVAGLVVVVVVGACLGYCSDWGSREQTRLDRQINAEIPLGSSFADVKTWLATHQFPADDPGEWPWTGLELSCVLHRDYTLDWSGTLILVFWFDDQSRLIGHEVTWHPIRGWSRWGHRRAVG